MSIAEMGKTVFVTVGTTSFDKLVKTVSSPAVCKRLHELGFSKLIIQCGRGIYKIEGTPRHGVDIETYDFKKCIADDISSADLVISHAGAGSIFETLEARKRLLVVINEDLMHNHQLELAEKLQEDRYLICTTCHKLESSLLLLDSMTLEPYASAKPEKFAHLIDELMGY